LKKVIGSKASGRMTCVTEKVMHATSIGIYYYANGDKFEGEWKNNNRDGKGKPFFYPIGILYLADGKKIEEQYLNGRLI